jgi:hypothetical protein
MVIVFFVTSADSGAMVVDTLASGGVANTPVWQRIFWASLIGIVAIALLIAGTERAANRDNSERITFLSDFTDIHIRIIKSPASGFDQA